MLNSENLTDRQFALACEARRFPVIATAAADGRIDHIEAPLCRDAADTIIATFLPLSSAGGAA